MGNKKRGIGMESLFDKLPYKTELDAWIDDYSISNDEDAMTSEPRAPLSYLMRLWEKNKQTLYKLLGNQFIIEKNVTFKTPVEDIRDQISDALHDDDKIRNFITAFSEWNQKIYSYDAYNRDWDKWTHGPRDIYYGLNSLTDPYCLARNIYDGLTIKPVINGKVITIQSGSKITRILAKIAEAANIPGYEEFRLEHSRFLNQKSLEGTLCLSIHPLDYYTMSDNAYGWNSCMNWMDSGCYRMGTVEMANSPYVIVAYFKGSKKLKFNNPKDGETLYWNSKKWRELFIVDQKAITGIKGYPYQNEEFDRLCLDWIAELANKNLGWTFVDHIYEVKPYGSDFDFLDINGNEVDFNLNTGAMYNDFGNSNISHIMLAPNVTDVDIYYSGETECMHCGAEISSLDGEDVDDWCDVVCRDCISYNYCDCCGERIAAGNEHELDGNTLCEDCYAQYAQYTPIDDEVHDSRNCILLYLMTDDDPKSLDLSYEDFIKRYKSIWVYYDGYDDFVRKFHTITFNGGWHLVVTYINKSDVTEDVLKYFDQYDVSC